VPLGSFAEVDRTCRLLRFQMARRTLGATTGPDAISDAWLAATTAHLRSLYRLLIEPAARALAGTRHWVIVPHGPLHRIPFHALHDGDAPVIDRRTVSYAPSAAVFLLCQQKSAASAGAPVVFGVPDDLAPYIREEAQMVAALLPHAQLFLAAEATTDRLQQAAASANCLHLATHGISRQDNPLFSSIRLGDSRLCLYDLDRFTLQAELVTLSGCATGVHETQGAGEIMGLARGLLTAGAHTVQLSLWEVSDRSTALYMSHFYSQLGSGLSVVAAGRQAMLATREAYPHPFHWAPFALTGRVKEFPPGIFYSHPIDPTHTSTK
jgi:CHAT domain-containing protein